MIVIRRTLKGTSFVVALELNEVEYAHLELVEGRKPGLRISLDQSVMGEMKRLAAHFERPGPMGCSVEDEAQDAMEIVF